MDRCALFVDAGYVLSDGAMAVHGTRRRESVSWDYEGLLQFLASLARERSALPLLRCYWYEATVEGRRSVDHDALADLPGVKLRLAKMRPGRREGVDTEIHRDLTTLARNKAISDALVVSAEEDLAQVIGDVQDLGLRVTMAHITVDGNWTISRALRQECDDIVEVTSAHLRPYVEMIVGAEPVRQDEQDGAELVTLRPLANGHSGNSGGTYKPLPVGSTGAHQAPPAIYSAPVVAEYSRSAPQPSRQRPGQGIDVPREEQQQEERQQEAMPPRRQDTAAQHQDQATASASARQDLYGVPVAAIADDRTSQAAEGRAADLPGYAPGAHEQYQPLQQEPAADAAALVQQAQGQQAQGQPAQPAAQQVQQAQVQQAAHNQLQQASAQQMPPQAGGQVRRLPTRDAASTPSFTASPAALPGVPVSGMPQGPQQGAPAAGQLQQSGIPGGRVGPPASMPAHLTQAPLAGQPGQGPQQGQGQPQGQPQPQQGQQAPSQPGQSQQQAQPSQQAQQGQGQQGQQPGLSAQVQQVQQAQGQVQQAQAQQGQVQQAPPMHGQPAPGQPAQAQAQVQQGQAQQQAQMLQQGQVQQGQVQQGQQASSQAAQLPNQQLSNGQLSNGQVPAQQLPNQLASNQQLPGLPNFTSAGSATAVGLSPVQPAQQAQAADGYITPALAPVGDAYADGYSQSRSGPQPVAPAGYAPAQSPPAQGQQQLPAGVSPAAVSPATVSVADAVQAAHEEGQDFGASVARDAPALWLEAVLARKPRMPSDLEARLLQGSALPIDFLLHDEVRHALRRGFWDALERSRR